MIDPATGRVLRRFFAPFPNSPSPAAATFAGWTKVSVRGDTVEAVYLGPGWHPVTVGQAGDCTALFVPTSPPPAQATRFDAVPFDSISAVRRGEEALSVASLRATYGGCSPF